MIRSLRPGLVFAVLIMAALPARAQESAPPPPERNPARSGEAPTETAAPEPTPDLPGDKPTLPWQDPKVTEARAACAEMLKGVTLDYEQLDPIKKGACGAPAPILVKSIGDPAVAISPPATMRCTLAKALDTWLKDTVQPAASALGTSVVKMRNASSYKCRNRYGATNTRISEHALANALDISEFVFASGQSYKVLGNWPYGASEAAELLAPTLPQPNPHRLAETWAAEDLALSRETTGSIVAISHPRALGGALAAVTKVKANPFVRPTPPPVAQPPQSGLPQRAKIARANTPIPTAKTTPFVSPLPPPDAEAPPAVDDEEEVAETPRTIAGAEAAAFLRAVHGDACKTFETVLGPEANAAHKDHFHFDMKKRRYVKICE